MALLIKKGLRTIGWIILSIVLGFIPAYFLTLFMEINDEPTAFRIWGLSALILVLPVRRVIVNMFKIEKPSAWESPQQIRDKVASAPRFVGRLDREKGLLECEVGEVEYDEVNQPHWASPSGINYRIIRLRGILRNHQDTIVDSVPVEIRAKPEDWVGTIVKGDRIRVEGEFESDGILHTDTAFNFSSNSLVGNRKSKK